MLCLGTDFLLKKTNKKPLKSSVVIWENVIISFIFMYSKMEREKNKKALEHRYVKYQIWSTLVHSFRL